MKRVTLALPILLLGLASHLAIAAEGGREDLDKATQLQLKAQTLRDTEQVISLCETALEKGLDDNDQQFAKQLLVGALWKHASQHAARLLEQQRLVPGWQQLRAIATRDLEKLLSHDDQFRDAYLLLARLESLPDGDRAKARTAIDRAIELFANNPRNQSEALLLRATLREQDEDRLADLNAAVAADPSHAEALEARAGFFRVQGEVQKAVDDLKKMLENDPENVAVLRALAEAFANLKQFDLALEHAGKAIELAPQQTRNFVLRAKIHEAMEEHQKAIADLDKAVELQPDDPGPLLDRAWLHFQQNDFASARADVDRVLLNDPGALRALMMRSMVAEAQNQFREAIADLELILSVSRDNPDLQLHLARLLMRDERPRKAIKVLTTILQADETNWEAHRTRGDALLSVGKHAEAIEDYNKGLQLKPDDDGILNNLAWVLATSPFDQLRDAKRSIELATRACEVTKFEFPHILSTLAAGYAEAGDFASAIKWSTMAVEKGKTDLKDQVDQLQLELDSYKKAQPWRELQEIKDKPDPPRNIIET